MNLGYINKFLVSPITESLFHDDSVDKDQMRYEKYLRTKVAKKTGSFPKTSFEGWKYYYSHNNVYVDFSSFYSVLTYITYDACTVLKSDKQRSAKFTLFTYGAVTIYLNGKEVCAVTTPCYKPIISKGFEVELEEGDNELYIRFQNLGVRDTRNLFGIKVDNEQGLSDSIPYLKESEELLNASDWLDQTTVVDNCLVFPSLHKNVVVGYDSKTPDFGQVDTRVVYNDASRIKVFKLAEGNPYIVLKVTVANQILKRNFELCEQVKPEYSDVFIVKENYLRQLRVIANADGLSRGDKFGFYIQNILARKALNQINLRDDEYFYITLQQIEDRYDCSDFLISGVIRYLKNYPVDEKLHNRIDDVFINYRYWMTMKGSDAMCFWSENHSLLFYSCAMLVGQMYPDTYFPRAEMTGIELSQFGRKLTLEWMDDLDEYGFEEFLSTVYMNVTFACLLNIIDYADNEIAKRAIKVTDRLLRGLSMHTFDGCVIAPMGRVYRGVIYPSKQGAQALMNLINPKVPTSFGEGWLSYYATSSYQIPSDSITLMEENIKTEYSTGDALIRLVKNKDYCLTSVQSPRMDGFKRWKNITLDEDVTKYENTHLYTKSFNERFHGTTFFQPGVFGYQQHMFSAALSNEALVFINQPGGACDSSSMRPGYWYGNGIMPAVKQDGNLLSAIYSIPDNYPLQFSHVFFPRCKFDEVKSEGNWRFARKENGYLALWCSTDLVEYNEELSNCELRSYSSLTGYLLLVGNKEESKDFTCFMNNAKSLTPVFDTTNKAMFIYGKLFNQFVLSKDDTQYV